MNVPEIKYADAGGVSIAYQVIGDGPRTVIGIPGLAQNIELVWDEPNARRFFERIGTICRLIHFDKRGTGLSDRSLDHSTLEDRVCDVTAVMDAEKVDRAVLAGFSEGASLAAFYAATYPERCEGLVLAGPFASYIQRDDMPWAFTKEQALANFEFGQEVWGQGVITSDLIAPSMARDENFRRWSAKYERQSINPASLRAYSRYVFDLDIRHVLRAISVPTLVTHAKGDRMVPFESGRYVAAVIPGAKFVELKSDDHAIWFGAQDAYLDAFEEFLTGAVAPASAERVLATVLFSDIIESTRRAAEIGDDAWKTLLDRHDRIAQDSVNRWDGRYVKSTGDGLLATFDGPSRAVKAACDLIDRVASETGLAMRVGLHCGEVERRGTDIAGIAVHLASRIQKLAPDSGVTVSRTVRDLVAGSGIRFADRGEHEMKGIEGAWQLFDVER